MTFRRQCEQRARDLILRSVPVVLALSAPSTVRAQTIPTPTGDNAATNATQQAPANMEEGPLLTVPIGRPFGFTHNEYVDLSETYDTNPLGLNGYVPGAKAGGDELTALALGIGLHEHTLRFTGDLQYSLTGDAYAQNSNYDQLYNYLNALATATLVPEHLFLHASAFAAPILVNGLGPIAAPGLPVSPGVNSGATDTYGYVVSPQLSFRLGDFARSDTIVSQSGLFFVQPGIPQVSEAAPVSGPPSQLLSYSASEQVSSGSDFNRLNWRILGTGSRVDESGIDYEQVSGVAYTTYAITRDIALLGTGGYETFSSNQALSERITGAQWYAGVRLGLGPRVHADFQAGEQFGGPSYIGDVNYTISPTTSLFGTLTDQIISPAAALLGGLGNLGANNQGNFYNTNYQIGPTPPTTISNVTGFNPAPIGGIAITDIISRSRAANLSFNHTVGRTQFRLSGYWNKFDSVVQNAAIPSETTTGGEFAVFRNINPFLSGGVTIDYTYNSILGGDFSTVSGSAFAAYQLSPRMQLYIRAAYIQRYANAALVAVSPITTNLSDTAITVGIRRNF